MKRRYIVLALLLLFVFFVYKLAAQPANNGISVSPSNFEFDNLAPGTSKTDSIRVMNLTSDPITITTILENFTASGEQGGVDLTDQNTSYSLASWITVTPTTVTIPAKTTKEFSFTVQIPLNAEPGGHFGSIVFRTIANPDGKETAAALNQEIASLLLVSVPGNVKEEANLESFTTDKQYYSQGPVTFTARVRNNGNVHVKPFGQILVTNMIGGKTTINIDPTNVLPNAIRRIPITWNQKLLIGRYTAQLVMGYGTKGQTLTATAIFWAFPIEYAVGIVIALLILFMLRKRLGKAIKAIVTGK